MSIEIDLAVARILDRGPEDGRDKYGAPFTRGRRSLAFLIEKYQDFPQAWSPSTNWQDAAPILEQLYGPDFLVKSMRTFIEQHL